MRTLAEGIRVTDAALTQIVVRAAESVEGVKVRRPRRHLQVDVAAGDARVSLDLSVAYGRVLPDAAREVQHRVADALGTMCGVSVRSVDVNVEAVA
ncbi:MAG TPA: Asp23/Gls24 family envelope stress response protein [Gaiellaceae bacterium]|nr:Asp23/Gls24 family envelope stress response protein [Gaiellaceae bacterium]